MKRNCDRKQNSRITTLLHKEICLGKEPEYTTKGHFLFLIKTMAICQGALLSDQRSLGTD